VHEEVVLMTTKGEAIAIGIAQMSTVDMSTCDHGVVAKVKRCIMERDLYPRRWGLGPTASEKKKLKASGKLDKYGRPNEATPTTWTSTYKDFHAPAEEGAAAADVSMTDAAVKTPVKTPAKVDVEETPAAGEDGESKKRKKHDGETAEEKAERKRLKAEKKAAKKAKRASMASAGDKSDDSD
jgi:H/ACA ribonucleoprotein complex subunit 4